MVPDKWGQGQLFAFSALDGDSFFTDDFSGILTGDKIGVSFQTIVRRTLYFGDMNKFVAPGLRCVASDMLLVDSLLGACSMMFAERHLVVGEYNKPCGVFVSLGGECRVVCKEDCEIHDTADGEYTALMKKDGRFAFSFAKSEDEAVALCHKGMELNPEEIKNKKLALFENAGSESGKYSSLYAKCISVMRSQLYSPEGNIRRIWSTPDRLPHRNMWLWDSVFHAIGHRHLDYNIAENLILALFDVQRSDGFIPHMARPGYISDITQPPVIAWGAWLVYEKSGNKGFLKAVLEKNKAFLLWCKQKRRKTEKELYSWHTNPELNNRCDESGMDNSPRFDTQSDLFAVDFSCYMANEARFMKKIADELSDKENADFFDGWYRKIKEDINSTLWCENDGFYYDFDITDNCFNSVQSVAAFLPVFAGICDESQCAKLISRLENPDEFGTEFPIPSISKKDPSFGSDMWRGPVWLNFNYMISRGLYEYSYKALAEKIEEKTLDVVNEWYNRTGTVYEFYDSENRIPPFCFNRKGQVFEPYDFRVKYQSIRDYGWSITLCFDMMNK